MEQGISALKSAIKLLGSQVEVAKVVGVTPQAVSEMARLGTRVPAEWCRPIERATKGKVKADHLRPDLYAGCKCTQ